jgi:hypothetical protein
MRPDKAFASSIVSLGRLAAASAMSERQHGVDLEIARHGEQAPRAGMNPAMAVRA